MNIAKYTMYWTWILWEKI